LLISYLQVARLTESDWHDQPDLSCLSIEESSRKAKYLFKRGIRRMKELGENIEFADK
jgi:hypothetical protein